MGEGRGEGERRGGEERGRGEGEEESSKMHQGGGFYWTTYTCTHDGVRPASIVVKSTLLGQVWGGWG